MSPLPTLQHVTPGEEPGTVKVTQVWTQADASTPLASRYQHLIPLTIKDEPILIAVEEGGGTASAFRVGMGEHAGITALASQFELAGPYDHIEPFVIGNKPHLLAYEAEDGEFTFFPIDDDLHSAPPYRYTRSHEPGVSAGFDTVSPMTIGGAVYYLCYDSKTGRVLIYSLSVTAHSPQAVAPLVSLPVWEHNWAHGWVRFAFFELGGGTFFLKTNVAKLNVNIDHVLDAPANGTSEVGTHLDLEDALELDIVRPFYLGTGEPYFLTYIKDGTTTINRIRGDCQGWVTEGKTMLPSTATAIVPFSLEGDCYLLVY